jgi:hypothetical protein
MKFTWTELAIKPGTPDYDQNIGDKMWTKNFIGLYSQ